MRPRRHPPLVRRLRAHAAHHRHPARVQGLGYSAGTPISMTLMDVTFNEKLYPKPNDFVPERWLRNPKAPDGESLEKYWVAFGKRQRNCLGIKYVHSYPNPLLPALTPKCMRIASNDIFYSLAYMELTIALATFYRRFQCELYETDFLDVELQYDFFLPSPRRDSRGVRVKIVAIES
jgi:cytochrome P450